MRVDSHQHYWRYDSRDYPWITADKSMLRRDFLPADLEPILQAVDIDGTLAVQAQSNEAETRWLLELADAHPFIRGVVGWVDLLAADVDDRLTRLRHPKLCGVRHILQDEPDVDFMLRREFRAGIRRLVEHDLTFDLLLFPQHLPNACALVAENPRQKFVLDHLSKPHIREGSTEPWQTDIRRLAQHDNVMCKVSGMVTEADLTRWATSDFAPYLEIVFDAFGPERVMFGSDWPVCLLAADYGEVTDIVNDYARSLSSDHREKLYGGNAIRFYGCEPLADG